MHQGGPLIGVAMVFLVLGAPLILVIAALFAARRTGGAAQSGWALTLNSALLYALAYNLTFFVQELFLVVPKALTPGLEPVLFHNNHDWTGDHPLERLFQGTGALAILILAGIMALWLRLAPPRSALPRLFLIWMVFQGTMQSLPQIPTAMMDPGTDVGVAAAYLGIGGAAMTAASFAAMAAVPLLALLLGQRMIAQGGAAARAAPAAFLLRIAALPALIGAVLTIPFRVPGSIGNVAVSPLLVAVMGAGWMLAAAWRPGAARPGGDALPGAVSLWPPAALLLLLAFFQLILRPGIAF